MKNFTWPLLALLALTLLVVACADDDERPTSPDREWLAVVSAPGSALLGVDGTSDENVYVVGADDGSGPLVLHFDGEDWTRLDTGLSGDLWWVHSVGDDVFMTGSDAHIIRYRGGNFERMTTPGLGKHIVFGLWASAVDDVYAVGAVAGRNGFIWHFDGASWRELDLPSDLPTDQNRDVPALLKVSGSSADDVWVVGDNGVILNGSAEMGFTQVASEARARLFSVFAQNSQVFAVGGAGSGVVLELGSAVRDVTPPLTPLLQGAHIDGDDVLWAVGAGGHVCADAGTGCQRISTGLDLPIQSLHSVWVAPSGDVWTVGGNVLDRQLDAGTVVVGSVSSSAPPPVIEVPDYAQAMAIDCADELVDPVPGGSIARRWNEQLLQAVRRDLPRPTVHARNLFHVSAALWDVWSAYDDRTLGYLVEESRVGPDTDVETAMSYAAYRLLTHRYGSAVGGETSTDCFNRFMAVLGLDPADTRTAGDSPVAFGNRVALAYIEAFANDGANEANDYVDPGGFEPDAPRLTVDSPGSNTNDTSSWQQIVLAEAVSQNGIPEGSGVRAYIGAHWGEVTPFAIERPEPGTPYYSPPNVPGGERDLASAAVEVLRYGAELDVEDGVEFDSSPASYGNNPLGTNDGNGYELNPFTGQRYEPNIVRRGDFTRLMAEFWADGPTSETPPGHWNTIANDASDHPEMQLRLFGEGEPLERLSWDVHLYLALNGALHDAAIAAWELKREHLTARPITLIRTLGARGQSSDPDGPSYARDGIPLVPGLIEVITEDSAADGGPHAHLSRYIGEIAVYSWRGEPGDRDAEVGGVGWIRAVEWVPYQRRTFVTPAFPGYVSGHSTFSRAAAEVLTQLTGDPYYPGGLGSHVLEPGWLFFEFGPSQPVEIQWATYYDGADQAGQSRLWGGIHVWQDDVDGRIVGDDIGRRAVAAASALYRR